MTNSLVGVLLRFHWEPVAVVAEFEALFHQILVDPKDVDALRFLWFPNGNLGRILLIPSLFSRLSSVFGRLQNPVLLVLSSINGRFRRPSKPSSLAGRLHRL